jgi:hypothetical protein
MLSNGDGVQKNQKRAVLFLERACDGGDLDGCAGAADAYNRGLGVERDVDKALAIGIKGCGQGKRGGFGQCMVVADSFKNRGDWANAAKFYRRECDLMDGPGAHPDSYCPALTELEEDKARNERIKAISEGVRQLDALVANSPDKVEGAATPSVPQVRMGTPTLSGPMPPEIVQRVVRQNYGRFRLCYEQGLTRSSKLEGRVTVRFVIGRNGSVTEVSNGGSDIPDSAVVQCVIRAYYGLSFPQPGGDIVTVVYPILFSPGA